LDEIQIIEPTSGNKLTQASLNKIDHIRKAIYSSNNYNQIGLFQFRIGLLMMEYGWFSEAAESFGKANNQWSFLPERPKICLANFAKGVAHHRGRRFDLAKQIYSEVEQQIIRIREDVSFPSAIPQIKRYQEFVRDLTAQLNEAQKTATRDIFHDLSPRIHPSLQTDSQKASATHLLEVDPKILQANVQRHLTLYEMQSLCFALKIDLNGLYGEGMANKARELVAFCIRNRRLSELLQELSRRKPSVSWEENIIQPTSDEIFSEDVLEGVPEPEDIIEALFEEVDIPEDKTEFFRTPLGKVRFQWEKERAGATSFQMVVVNIDLSGDFNEFSLEQQDQFVHFISRITAIDPDQVTILEVIDGSIKVTLEMPDESARLLINMLLEKDPILKNFRILKVELGELVEQARINQPIINNTPNLLQQVTAQKLRQFIFLYFNDNELRDIYFDLDVDYDSLPGQGKRDKAREIVAFCNRHKKFDLLIELCQAERPKTFLEVFSISLGAEPTDL
jgi:hypothetical protein